ncbi:MAG: PEP-CTERM sorting domain-containing protein [Rhodocyclales bacterium GT-UBC]|nr:MAG: PEP-CTERM sorting domain-containing protein [Rhodocyclales bacterium GT-UBC]
MSIKAAFALVVFWFSSLANAAYVTIDEVGMDAIFSQASFGNSKVDIRIGAQTQLVFPDLLDISSDAEISSLFAKHVGSQTVVNFYFVDTISACGGSINVNFIGCGEVVGQDFVVESDWAADPVYGANLLAHELGHNLGLVHRSGNVLMDPFISTFSELNAAEVATILSSPLVHSDANGLFILINPVLIVAAANGVPEPATLLLICAGLLAGVGVRGRFRTQSA